MLAKKNNKNICENISYIIFFILGMIAVLFVIIVSIYLIISGIPAIKQIGIKNFFFDTKWSPTSANPHFGILPFILTSVYATFFSVIISIPVSFFSSIYISKLSSEKIKKIIQNMLSILSGIPSVVYGLVGMFFLVPLIKKIFHLPDGSSLFASIIVLFVMILPTVIKISVDALDSVPKEYEEAALALGATETETYFKISAVFARSGIAAAIIMGVGRAMGEAMAVMMVSGNASNMPKLFQSVRFLTTAIASEMSYADGLQRKALFSIALTLFIFILIINFFLNFVIKYSRSSK